ncbi:hypothetical protein SFRURICE_008262 [Spodoptera frugiperda]|nr:hypothetical protein SFRURICE_008262 [Spodoptera frugiperda]
MQWALVLQLKSTTQYQCRSIGIGIKCKPSDLYKTAQIILLLSTKLWDVVRDKVVMITAPVARNVRHCNPDPAFQCLSRVLLPAVAAVMLWLHKRAAAELDRAALCWEHRHTDVMSSNDAVI